MAAHFRFLFTLRGLAIWGTALLALGVVVGGVRLGSNGYEQWTPERDLTQPLAGIVAGLVDAPHRQPAAAQAEPLAPVAPAGEEESAIGTPAPPASTLMATPEAAPPPALTLGGDANTTVDPATPTPELPGVVGPSVEHLPPPSNLPGWARSQEMAPWASRRTNPFDESGLPSSAKVPSELGVEKIGKPADAKPWPMARA